MERTNLTVQARRVASILRRKLEDENIDRQSVNKILYGSLEYFSKNDRHEWSVKCS